MKRENIKLGMKVLLTANNLSPYYRNLADRGIYGVVTYLESIRYSFFANISFEESIPFDKNAGIWGIYDTNDIEEVTDFEQCKKSIKIYQEDIERIEKQITDYLLTPPDTTLWSKRDLNLESKQFIATCYNMVELGTWKDNTFMATGYVWGGTCCSFTKTMFDLRIYIPKAWLHYYGYSEKRLINYLRFLSKCDIGFQYEYNGELPLSPGLKCKRKDKVGTFTPEALFDITIASNHENHHIAYPLRDDDYYTVTVKHGESEYHTYMFFLLLRYIYNHNYWNIPATAMHIKRSLGNKITHFQALLMAHMRQQYNVSYGLLRESQKVDIFQDFTNVLPKLMLNNGLNECWTQTTNHNVSKVNKYFENKDFEGLLDYLKN